jgi:hypothetical protein
MGRQVAKSTAKPLLTRVLLALGAVGMVLFVAREIPSMAREVKILRM